MYVYLGKFDWKGASSKAENEAFIVVLPNGPVRAGDTAYVFFQWTKDDHGVEKANWFQTIFIDTATKTDAGDDVFTLKHHKFSWEITSQQVYEKLKIKMSGTDGVKTSIDLSRVWGTHSNGGKAKDTARLWTGKINWYNFAKNEMAMFIVPEGFGEGRPVVSLWQWTVNADHKEKAASLHCEYQKIQNESESGVKFTYNSYYDVTCDWNKKSGKLSVHMRNSRNKASQDLGEFTIAAVVDDDHHELGPPESTPNKAEVEFRLPQPQPSLPHILSPMPFPRSLVDTLTHAKAFIDYAGYLAKYEEGQYHNLHSEFHLRKQRLDTAKASIKGLKKSVKKSQGDLDAEKERAAKLAKELQEARDSAKAKEAELNKKLAKAREDLADAKLHDAKDHKFIKDLQDEFEKERTALNADITDLRQKLTVAETALAASESKLKAALQAIRDLENEIRGLEAKLTVEKEYSSSLKKERDALADEVKNLRTQVPGLQGDLVKVTKAKGEADDRIKNLENDLKGAREERDGALRDRDIANLSVTSANSAKSTVEIDRKNKEARIEKLEEKVRALGGTP